MKPGKLNLYIVTGTTFGPLIFTIKDSNLDPVDLTGYNAFAEVRLRAGASKVILDLAPVITNAAVGEITIPKIVDEDTYNMKFVHAKWSLLLEQPNGDRVGPFIEGKFIIQGTPTKPIET